MQISKFDKRKHLAGLRKCAIALQDYEHRLDGRLPSGADIIDDYMDQMFFRCKQCDGELLVADIDGEMVGYAMVLNRVTSDDLEDGDIEYGLIADLFVFEQHRGRGHGQALLQAAEDHARRSGVRWLRIGVLSKNAAADGLYSRMGFSKIYVEREKDLERD